MAIANYLWFKMFRNGKQIINHQTAPICQSMSFTENGERHSRVLGSEQIVSQNLIQSCGLQLINYEKNEYLYIINKEIIRTLLLRFGHTKSYLYFKVILKILIR